MAARRGLVLVGLCVGPPVGVGVEEVVGPGAGAAGLFSPAGVVAGGGDLDPQHLTVSLVVDSGGDQHHGVEHPSETKEAWNTFFAGPAPASGEEAISVDPVLCFSATDRICHSPTRSAGLVDFPASNRRWNRWRGGPGLSACPAVVGDALVSGVDELDAAALVRLVGVEVAWHR